MDPKEIAIIGGGPGGLMTAYLLEQRATFPCDITIFEAGPRVGGKILTSQFGTAPVAYEAGAAELYDYSLVGLDPLREMIDSFGLPTRSMSGETVVLRERFLKNDADIYRAFGKETYKALRRFRKRARAAISPAEYYESDWRAENENPLMHRSFRSVLDEIPDDTARRYLEVMLHSDIATEPESTNGTYGLQNYLMNLPEYMRLYSIDGGIERLPRELAKRLSAGIRLNEPVVRVERAEDEGYRVFTRIQGEVVCEEFDFVVVALPLDWIPAVEWGGPVLDKAMREHVKHYTHPAHYLRVSVLFDRPFWRERMDESYFMLDAFGGCCVYDESARQDAGPYGVLGWLLSGSDAENLSRLDDSVLIRKALDSLPSALAYGKEACLEGRVHRWIGAVNGLPGGCPAREPDSRHVPEPVDHPWLFVVGDYLFDSTINGVLDSADTVVEWIREEVTENAGEQMGAPITVPENEVLIAAE